jgi:hypothetical protein
MNNERVTANEIHIIKPYSPVDKKIRLAYRPDHLADGSYEMAIKFGGQPTLQNSANSFQFSICSSLTLSRIVNFPNPFSSTTKFTYILENDKSAAVTIKIYTVAGRLIKTIEYAPGDVGYNEVEWDGRDAYGETLANGVYFYKIVAGDDDEKAEVIERLVVVR